MREQPPKNSLHFLFLPLILGKLWSPCCWHHILFGQERQFSQIICGVHLRQRSFFHFIFWNSDPFSHWNMTSLVSREYHFFRKGKFAGHFKALSMLFLSEWVLEYSATKTVTFIDNARHGHCSLPSKCQHYINNAGLYTDEAYELHVLCVGVYQHWLLCLTFHIHKVFTFCPDHGKVLLLLVSLSCDAARWTSIHFPTLWVQVAC